MNVRRHRSRRLSVQSGQAALVIVILIGVFVIGMVGMAADYTQIWAHRQMAQGAADAACQAGAADLYLNYVNPSASSAFGLNFSWIGTDYSCSANDPTPPCKYAAMNGYPGSGVSVSFPSSVPGVPLTGFSVPHPFIKVTITDPVQMSFIKVITRTPTVNSGASAVCGLNPVTSTIPLVVLHSTASGSMLLNGGPTFTVIGGPNRSIQVDSSSTTAVNVGAGTIDLSQAGPAGPPGTGADFGVFGGPSTKPAGVLLGTTGHWVYPDLPLGDPWVTIAAPAVPGSAGTATPVSLGVNGCPDPNGCVEFSGGNYTGCSTGTIDLSAKPLPSTNGCLMVPFGGSNPKFSIINRTPNNPYVVGNFIKPTFNNPGNYYFKVVACTGLCTSAATPNNTFPLVPPWNQVIGNNQTDGLVTWQNVGILSTTPNTAIFDPGLYYVGANGLQLKSNSYARMSTGVVGDNTSGATIYFSTGDTLSVDSNSGKSGISNICTAAVPGNGVPNGCVVSYKPNGSTSSVALGSVPSRALQCPAAGSPAIPSQVPATLDGNILMGPCSGPSPGQAQNYGDASGQNRGFLFFQNRASPASPTWNGGGQFLLSGFMYFHSSTTGTNCGSTTTCLTLSGNAGAGAFTLGNIVTDEITLGGASGVEMILNPFVTFQLLKPQLLQ
jgi:hypothetical protein